jgi:hypothetical protein
VPQKRHVHGPPASFEQQRRSTPAKSRLTG